MAMEKVTKQKLEAEIKFLIMTFEADLLRAGANINDLDYKELRSARNLFKSRVVGLIENREV